MLSIAVRYLRGHARQYLFVLIVLALGFAFITVASSLSDGMQRSVTNAALRHYAGHLFVIGRDKQAGSLMVIDHPDEVSQAIDAANLPLQRIIRRTHLHNDAVLYAQGNMVRLKDLFGVDFSAEADLFSGFEYADGEFSPAWDDRSIVLSRPTAQQLRVRAGDEVVLRVQTRRRQVDTRTLIVRAVTTDASIYGYARAYMARPALNSVMDLDPADHSLVGIFVPELTDASHWARQLHPQLERRVPVSGPIETKEALTTSIREQWQGVRYFTFALPVYISEVTDLLTAMQIGAYLLLVMIILVVLAAATVTYRVVLHDRTREIGTMLAVGFPRFRVVAMLLTEALILVAVGIAAGLILSLAITRALSFVSFAWIPGFDIFLHEGRLVARYTVRAVATNVLIAAGAVTPAIGAMVVAMVYRRIPALIKGETR